MRAIMLLIFLLCLLSSVNASALDREIVYKTLIAEAVSEGETGMRAVACVIRNRSAINNLRVEDVIAKGFYGSKRKDLDEFVNNQGARYTKLARRIVKEIFIEDYPDVTNGATHFENIKAFGVPYWAKDMKQVAKIGSHTFWKE